MIQIVYGDCIVLLLNNRIKGADVGFKKQLRIVGLGYKAVLTGSNIQFSLGL